MSTYNGADAKEPDDHVHDLHQILCVLPHLTIHLDLPQKLQTHIQIEDGADSNRAKEADEKCLTLLFNLGNVLVHGVNNRWTPKQEHEDAKENQAVDRNDVVVSELGPWTDGTEPDEDCDVEKHVDCGLERVVHCFEAEPRSLYLAYIAWVDSFDTYQSSHVNVLPAMKQANTSSLPTMPTVPTMNSCVGSVLQCERGHFTDLQLV